MDVVVVLIHWQIRHWWKHCHLIMQVLPVYILKLRLKFADAKTNSYFFKHRKIYLAIVFAYKRFLIGKKRCQYSNGRQHDNDVKRNNSSFLSAELLPYVGPIALVLILLRNYYCFHYFLE